MGETPVQELGKNRDMYQYPQSLQYTGQLYELLLWLTNVCIEALKGINEVIFFILVCSTTVFRLL